MWKRCSLQGGAENWGLGEKFCHEHAGDNTTVNVSQNIGKWGVPGGLSWLDIHLLILA